MLTPNFAGTPNSNGGNINTANTNIDGTGTLTTLWTAGASGGRLDSLQIKGRVAEGSTQAADTIRLFWDDGANKHPFREIIVPAGAGVVSPTLANFETVVAIGVSVKAGWILKASTHTGGALGSYEGLAFGGDY